MKEKYQAQGAKAPFEAAARTAYPNLFAAAMVLTSSRTDAEDAVQETLARACAAYGRFRGDCSPTTWMYRILVRLAARERGKGRAASLDDCEEPSAPVPGPQEQSALTEECRVVLEALRALPGRQKEMATLFYLEEMSQAEVADALGVSPGAVKTALYRARLSIRESLGLKAPERKVPDETL